MCWKLKQPFLLHRVRGVVIEHVDDTPLLVMPGVLNPVVFRSGEVLARIVARFPAPGAGSTAGPLHALDMGTGSGIGAIFAARRGYQVIGVDISPEAVRCARINVLLNHVEDRVEIRQGDLFDVVQGDRFDLVLFNPPFFVGHPSSAAQMAWRSPDVMERFAAGVSQVLKPGGCALVLLSTDGAPERMLTAFRDQQFAVDIVAERDLGNEIMSVYSARRGILEQEGGFVRDAQSDSG